MGKTTAVTGPQEQEKKALKTRTQILQLATEAQATFLEMRKLLYEAREEAQWSVLRYESYKEYIEDLGLPMTNSYSWATRLVGIYEYMVVKMGLSNEDLIQIGVAKLSRLLPAAREGKLTAELIEQAKVLSDMDLRVELGHNVGGGSADTAIVCPRCGAEIPNARWVSGSKAEK